MTLRVHPRPSLFFPVTVTLSPAIPIVEAPQMFHSTRASYLPLHYGAPFTCHKCVYTLCLYVGQLPIATAKCLK